MHALTYYFLGLAVIAVWLPPFRSGERVSIPPWTLLYGAAVACGLWQGFIDWRALFSITALVLAAVAACRLSGALRIAATVVAALLALALAMHLLPGFANPKLLDAVRLSAGAAPFTLYLNFDKASAGLLLLATFAPRLRRGDRIAALVGIVSAGAALTTAITMGVAVALGVTAVDPKWPGAGIALGFLAVNLLFTCVTEEAFFRGLLQERLPAAVAMLVSALLFGLAHLPGGLAMAGLATLAGLGYAFVYQRTRRIEAAIATHFILNAVHFFFFAYPALSR